MLSRFSTDDYQCDIEVSNPHGMSGQVFISVANVRLEFLEPLPARVPIENNEEYVARQKEVHRIVKMANKKEIDHEMAGQQATLELNMAVTVLIGLKKEGLRVPDYVIEELLSCQADFNKVIEEDSGLILPDKDIIRLDS